MEKLKFTLVAIVTLTLLGIFGYWAVTTIQSGTEHVKDQKIKQLEQENDDLKKEIEKQKNSLNALQSNVEKPVQPVVKKEPIVVTVYKHQALINELQKLLSSNIVLKLKSRGPAVGSVQKFLNVYNNTSNRIDNDYGANMVKAVTAFQTDMQVKTTGEVNAETFDQMIEWLQEQG